MNFRVDPTGLKKVIPQFLGNPYTQLGINYALGTGIGALGQAGFNAATETNNANPLIAGLQMAPLIGGKGLAKFIGTPELEALRAKNQYINILEDGSASALFGGTVANLGNAISGGRDIDTTMVGSVGYYGQALPLGKKVWADLFAREFPITTAIG